MSRPDRVAVVTGTAGGIGSASAIELSRTCQIIVGLDRPGADQSAAREGVRALGAEYIALECDVADEGDVANAFDEIARQVGAVDVLAHIAGVGGNSADGSVPRIAETQLSDWNRVVATNLTGTFLVCRAAIPLITQSGAGRIVTTASQTARLPTQVSGGHYPASKGGVIMFTRVLALELAEYGVTVNCVSPGLTDTAMASAFDQASYSRNVPLGRIARPIDLARAVAFLASPDNEFITGVVLDVNGGMAMA